MALREFRVLLMENDAWMIPALWMARYSSIRSDMRIVAQRLKAVMSVENMDGNVR